MHPSQSLYCTYCSDYSREQHNIYKNNISEYWTIKMTACYWAYILK